MVRQFEDDRNFSVLLQHENKIQFYIFALFVHFY